MLKRVVKKKNCPLVSKKRMFRKKHDFNNVKFEGYFHPFNINNGPIKKNGSEKFSDKLFPFLNFAQNKFLEVNIIMIITFNLNYSRPILIKSSIPTLKLIYPPCVTFRKYIYYCVKILNEI